MQGRAERRARLAAPETAREPRTMWTSASPSSASISVPAYRSWPSRSNDPSRWSSRPPPPTRRRRSGLGASAIAASSASSRSVASFVRRMTSRPRARRPRRPRARRGETESKSPIATCDLAGRAPARGRRRRRRRSPSRACGQLGGTAAPGSRLLRRRRRRCVLHAFLRWHYPDQVLRVGGAS